MLEIKELNKLLLKLKTFPKIYWLMFYRERNLKEIQNLKILQLNKKKRMWWK